MGSNELLQIIILAICVTPFLIALLFRVIEPFYMFVFNKPLYLYWYPFPKSISNKQRLILENNFPFYDRLSLKKKKYFEHRLKGFLNRYLFIGKDIQITDEMRILIGATYVMLTFGLRKYFTGLFSRIIIYPSAYYSSVNSSYHKGEFNPKMKSVVFSWKILFWDIVFKMIISIWVYMNLLMSYIFIV
ncbi:zinc-dependent peptidase [Flavobacterium faecale]|uniref:zinc-dependent peptidase n=1 Tax=Flavobacterium faecale TaxID=1355330 RepID=UPI003AAC0D96